MLLAEKPLKPQVPIYILFVVSLQPFLCHCLFPTFRADLPLAPWAEYPAGWIGLVCVLGVGAE